MAGAKLRQKNGDSPGREIVLRGPSIVGRNATVTIPINDDEVSKQHAEFVPRGADWFLTDLQSRNGTWINGQKLAPNQSVKLQSGSLLQFGKTEFVYEQEAQQPQNSPPSPNPLPNPNPPPQPHDPAFDQPSQVFALRPCLTVGRDPTCDIVL